MAQYSTNYYAQKARERRALENYIKKYHAWEQMPGESFKDFKRRMTKRIVVIVEDVKIIQDPFGKILSIEENKSEHTTI